MIDARLQQILDNAEHPISKAILRGLFEDDNFKEYMCQRVEHLVCEHRAKLGYDMTNETWTWGEDEELDEGIGNALMHLVRTTAANALGVRPSTIHGFTKALSNRPKKVAAPKVSAQKPPKTGSQHNTPQKNVEPVELHHVFNGTPSDHEHSLQQALNHHNIGTFAKSKGDTSKAEIHFRARDKHFKNYVSNAPRENLTKLNQGKVKSIFN